MMKNNTCLKEFAKYASLNVFGMIGLSFYILADTFFVAKGLGANGLAALNLAIPIYSFIHGSGLMLGMGSATRYTIQKSRKEMGKAAQTFTNAVIITLWVSAVFFAIGLFLSSTITKLLGADESVFAMSKTYLQVILLFAPVFMLNNVFLCFVRNDGAPQLSMIAMLGGSFSNIILDYIFIFPFNMGIFGAVLATGLAPVISMLILSTFFLGKKNTFHLVKCKVSWQILHSIFSNGLPSFVTEVSSGIVILIFNTLILKLAGNTGVAAYGVIANLSLVVIAVYTGIAQGIQPIISSNYGKRNHQNVQAILRYAITTVTVVSAIVYLWVFIGASQIVYIFNTEQNMLLQTIAVSGIKIYFSACVCAGLNIILSVYFTSTQNSRPAHIISLLRGFFVIIPLAFLLSWLGGITGIWCVFPLTEFIVCLIGGTLYAFSRRTQGAKIPQV